MLEQKLYTVADVAELTGLTSRTIRNYLKDGTLRGRKIGVQWRFTEEDINRLFSEVDGEGQKVMHIEDVVSAFLKERTVTEPEGCLTVTIPFTKTSEMKQYQKKVIEFLNTDGKELMTAFKALEEEGILRIAVSGDMIKIEELAARMKEF